MPKTSQKLKLRSYVLPEHDEQVTICDVLEQLGLVYFAIPNYRPLDNNWAYWNYLLVTCNSDIGHVSDRVAPRAQ